MSQIRIGGACLNQTPIDWQNNLSNISQAIQEAQSKKVTILCLPELCITGYGCQDLFLHKWLMDTSLSKLQEVVDLCSGITVAVGLPILYHGNVYNTTCLIENKSILGFYAKQILANDGIHYENRWFSSWSKGITGTIEVYGTSYPIGDLTFEINGLHVGIEICEDAWKPDRPASHWQDKKIDLILNPSASHFAFGKHKTREALVVNSSQQFECHYLYTNQLGNESGRVIYDGDIILASHGELLATHQRLSFQPYHVLYYDIDTDGQTNTILHHDDSLDNNKDFAKAVSLGLFDYLRKSKTKGYTLSLSGGADSSTVAVLVAEMVKNGIAALGAEEFAATIGIELEKIEHISNQELIKHMVGKVLITAYQGTKNSSQDTFESAQSLAVSIGAQFKSWTIDSIVDANHQTVEEAIDRKLSWEEDDISLQNIQARSRSPLIWMLANVTTTILLTTSNRSEGDVGYTTMDGDTSGSLAPIAGVDKPFILQWLKYAEKELGYTGLAHVNQLNPSAELRPSSYTQTDEEDLMPYPILLKIERLGIYERKPPIEIYTILSKELSISPTLLKTYIKKFFRLWSINQWKRERIAPSFHLDDFNVDPKTWCRFPILSGGYTEELRQLDEL